MAWQPYVDELLKHGHLESAAIVGASDALIWAASPGFQLTAYNLEVEVDVGKTQTVQVNEQASLLEGSCLIMYSILHCRSTKRTSWSQTQWCEVRSDYLRC